MPEPYQPHFPLLFSHANADAPPTGFAGRVFAGAAIAMFSFDLSLDTALCDPALPWPSSTLPVLCLPSSKKRDCPPVDGDAVCEADVESVRAVLLGRSTLMPVSRRW